MRILILIALGFWSTMAMAENKEPTKEEKIADALRAAPPFIANSATVVDRESMTVLREGTPEWTCVPSALGAPYPNPMCGDPTTMQWFRDVVHGKSPTIDRIGISYMLMGETGADFYHPEAKEPPKGKDWYRVGPHLMFVFPESAGDITKGIGADTSSGQPYARPFKGAQPLLVVPIAMPNEVIDVKKAKP
jgi:hypothetical protein